MKESQEMRLTQYSHGGGCGCKIAPAYLDRILTSNLAIPNSGAKAPLVSYLERDDAAVYDLGNGQGLVSSLDFFMPLVDDPYDFGRVAAANALSDIYAMGASPWTALAILGWPVQLLSEKAARKVIEGAESICLQAGIVISGGHSIDNPEPLFGLAVNGRVSISNIKRNCTARPGDLLFLTKPLGVGIICTAGKKGCASQDDLRIALNLMLRLNHEGEQLGSLPGVTAMTDVTGFGLFGHLCEMCGNDDLTAQIEFDSLPRLPNLEVYMEQGCTTGGGIRNLKSYGDKVHASSEFQRTLMSDPQTNGGLLIAVDPAQLGAFEDLIEALGLTRGCARIGCFGQRSGTGVKVKVS